MYYLQSRYYDATICRFINADGYVSTGQGVIGNNMFAYCNNNPVMYVDHSGAFSIAIIGLVILIGAVGVLLTSCASQKVTEAQIENAKNAAEQAKFGARTDEYGQYITIDIYIKTQYTMDSVAYIAYNYYYDTLYENYLNKAKSLGISEDKLMTKSHIKWELQAHMFGQLFHHPRADSAHLNIEETIWTMLGRVF